MRIRKYLLFFLSFICSHTGIEVLGQETRRPPDPSAYYCEDLMITTDRQIFITGEKVNLKLYVTACQSGKSAGLSKVAYLELINPSNNPVIQIKMKIEGTSGFSSFILSDTLSSGNYLIRAYTAWIRNYPEDLFAYRVISVINPFKDLNKITTSATIPVPELNPFHPDSEKSPPNLSAGDAIKIKTHLDKDIYGTREKIRVELSIADHGGKIDHTDLSISVIKSFLSESNLNSLTENQYSEKRNRDLSGYPAHLPEPEGELLRGTIFNKITFEPLNNTDISLSIIGKKARCQFMKTNSEGEFIFVLKDLTGIEEIVIQPLNPEPSGSYVELRHPFSDTYGSFSVPSLRMDSATARLINNAVIAVQVNRMYENEIPKDQPGTITEMNNFFGDPVKSVRTVDYIELTDIREVVKEIIPEVVLFRKDRQPALKVTSSNPYQIFSNKALVLLDGVPVADIEKLLSISARELERVEIINSRYFYADYVFEGIISFITKKGNLSSLEEDNSFFRQVFEGCLKTEEFYSPAYDSDSSRLSRIPDFRNTLYWNPDVTVSEGKTAEIEFYTSDEAAEYLIVAEGFTSDGRRIRSTVPLIVR